MRDTTVLEQVRDALVVAVDDSPPAAEALRFAARLAQQSGRPLHVLMVWNVIIGPWPTGTWEDPPTEQDRQQTAEQVLAALVEQALPGTDRPPLHLHAVHGNVSPVLQEVSSVAEHVVVGSRGRGGVAGLLLGSTSEELVRRGCCPVTVVPSGR